MNQIFFQQIEGILTSERLDAYRQDGVPPVTTLARYLWNMALCESLYSPLQMAEIALRNSLHHSRLFLVSKSLVLYNHPHGEHRQH
jgi:hypothetical protein